MEGQAAAIDAGYSRKTAAVQASRLLKRVHVKAAIDAAKKQRSEATGIDAEWVLREAVALYQKCINEIKPALHPKTRRQMTDDQGNPLFVFNAAVAARALELVGKHISVGAWEERIQVTPASSIVERLNAGRARAAARNRPLIDVTPEEN
jgi:phage terminase small subunit